MYACLAARFFNVYEPLSIYLPTCLLSIYLLVRYIFFIDSSCPFFPSLPFSPDPPTASITSSQLTSPPYTLTFSHGDQDTPSILCYADGNPLSTVLWQVKQHTHSILLPSSLNTLSLLLLFVPSNTSSSFPSFSLFFLLLCF